MPWRIPAKAIRPRSNKIMDYIKPVEVMETMIKSGISKSALGPRDLLIRGFLSGALLAFATSLAITATLQTGVALVGALVFPVGFVIIVLLGLVAGHASDVDRTLHPLRHLASHRWSRSASTLARDRAACARLIS